MTRRTITSALLLALFGLSGFASAAPADKISDQPLNNHAAWLERGGGSYDPPSDHIDPIRRGQLLAQARRTKAELGLLTNTEVKDSKGMAQPADSLSPLALPDGSTRLLWPVRPGANNRNDFQTGVSNYVDLDAAPNSLLDFACGTRTYDRASGYNHNGIDIASWPYPWTVMDEDGLDVVAAADGVIVSKVGDLSDRSCTTNTNARWNVIVLAHSDGKQTVYGHLKRNSLTSKAIGDSVSAGEFLGQVGSSGISTGPHLHFELLDENDNNMDPYAGSCGTADSHWRWQPDYNRARVNAVLVGHAAPVLGNCDGSEQANLKTSFTPGDAIYISSYFVNQAEGEAARLELIAPDGSVWLDAPMGTPAQDYAFSYWYRSFTAPQIVGQWRSRISLNGEISEAGFTIGEPATDGLLVAAVLPGSRSVGLSQSASIFATMANAGQVVLEGCRVLPLGPFAGQLRYQATDPATNQLVGSANQPVSIPVGGARSFILTLDPSVAVEASNVRFNFKCNNAPRARSVRGLNTLQFSAAAAASADILPISATPAGDGVVRLNGVSGAAAFGTAALNIGTEVSNVNVVPQAEGIDLNMTVCETDSAGVCQSPPAPSIVADFGGAARTFSVFVSGTGDQVPFDPENNRVELRFEHNGEVRGVTSVAVTTQ